MPLLAIDAWEHAYYLQYKNVKADFFDGDLERLRLGGRGTEAQGRSRHRVGPEPLGLRPANPTTNAHAGASRRSESRRRSALAGAAFDGSTADATNCPAGHNTDASAPNTNACGNWNGLMSSAPMANVVTTTAVMPAIGPSKGLLAPEPTR